MNLLMKGAALAPPFSCTTKYSSDVYSPRPPDIRVRLLPTKPPVHFTTEQPGRDNDGSALYTQFYRLRAAAVRTCFAVCPYNRPGMCASLWGFRYGAAGRRPGHAILPGNLRYAGGDLPSSCFPVGKCGGAVRRAGDCGGHPARGPFAVRRGRVSGLYG